MAVVKAKLAGAISRNLKIVVEGLNLHLLLLVSLSVKGTDDTVSNSF